MVPEHFREDPIRDPEEAAAQAPDLIRQAGSAGLAMASA